MSTPYTVASILETFRADRDEMQRAYDGSANSLVSHGWVIAIRSGGTIMCWNPEIVDRRVVNLRPSNIMRCARLTREDAARVCANGNIRNGNGETAEPMYYRDVLREGIAHLSKLIDKLEADA